MQDEEPVDLRTDSEYTGRVKYYCDKTTCTLRIADLRESDSAEYKFKFKFKTKRNRIFSNLPGVTLSVINPALQVQVRRSYSLWTVLFCNSTCHLSDRPSYIWYKNGQKIQGETTSSYADYFYPEDSVSCAVIGHEDFPSPSVCVHGQPCNRVTYTDRNICAFKGSSADISCTYNSHKDKVESKFWFRPQHSHQWQNPSEPGDLGQDSQYSALQIVVTRIVTVHESYTEAELNCHSSCSPTGHFSYVWFKNGQKLLEETSTYTHDFYPGDNITCAFKGYEGYRSPSVCVNGQSCNRVTYTDRDICALKGSSVDISSSYNSYTNNVESKFWFRFEHSPHWQNPSWPEDLTKDPQYSGRVQVLEASTGRSTLRITDLRKSDSAQYRFKFKSAWFEFGSDLPGTTLTVTDIQVVMFGSSFNRKFKCDTTCHLLDGSSYVWFENGRKMDGENSYFYSVSANYGNSYSCAIKGLENFPSSPLCISDSNCNKVTYTHRNICAPEGSSVEISCTYQSPQYYIESKFWFIAEHQWLYPSEPKDLLQDAQFLGRAEVSEVWPSGSTLRISRLRKNDSAQYHFKFKTQSLEWGNDLPGTTLTVTALQVQVTRTITSNQSPTRAELKCHSSCSPTGLFSYVWFENGQKLLEETASYTHDFYPGDNISCAFRGYEDYPSPSVYAPRAALAVVSPSGQIVEDSSVTLTCSSDANPAAIYTWYNNRETFISRGPEFVFNTIHSSDSGEYSCTADNGLGKSTGNIVINVKYAPKTSSVSVSPSGQIVEGSSVTLTCSSDANPAAKYTWYKENQTLPGKQERIHFNPISSEDKGIYHCRSENQYGQLNSSSVVIDVQYPPRLLSVSVSPSGQIVEGSSVTLTCSDANPAAKYLNEKRGRQNSTLRSTVLASSAKSAAAASITVILILAVIPLVAFLWIRRKRFLKPPSERGEGPGNKAEQNVGSGNEEQPDELFYASVSFSKNQEDPLYSNITPAQPNRHKTEEEEEDEEDVEYTAVNIKSPNATPKLTRQQPVEDACSLYSTVSKKCKV
ncbi:hemicentin-1-like isoform X1 [Lates japonicus]|uniref:Hemicentin-1-like isoform X1 n=1 Tax=Lates japonicus TaxID=270547 RepID=A0AAD3N8P0_LATJO|nr:hemicentin-1-like isoform X1 [Lates japonicus]